MNWRIACTMPPKKHADAHPEHDTSMIEEKAAPGSRKAPLFSNGDYVRILPSVLAFVSSDQRNEQLLSRAFS